MLHKPVYPDFEREAETVRRFLLEFEDPNSMVSAGEEPHRKYMKMLQEVSNRERKLVTIDLEDLALFVKDERFVQTVLYNSLRYMKMFAEIIDSIMPAPQSEPDVLDVADMIELSRKSTLQVSGGGGPSSGGAPGAMAPPGGAAAAPGSDPKNQLPVDLRRRYELSLTPPSKSIKTVSLRQLRGSEVGKLVSVEGIVTRVTEVKPKVLVATYACDRCGFEVYQEINQRVFMPPSACPSEVCKANKSIGHLVAMTRASKFIKFQEARIQELPSDVPIGHVPRTMVIHLHGDLTQRFTTGDRVTLCAIPLPIQLSGFRALRQGQVADVFLHAVHVARSKRSYGEMDLSPEKQAEIGDWSKRTDVYARLSRSIAPEIFGHDDIKKALLLLLVGGVTRNLPDGMRIRGDINICLMGDPGVAKSQLLKAIAKISPRGVFTSGRSSSGAGLTAAVVKDQFTGEVVLEGGALVLADNGVCCIDEFDKMDEFDRTCIHEVMEQQTVSIAKAGITTTLNARCSMLAAANPAYGRYNPDATASENINLPASLLSRFDLLYLVLDTPDQNADKALAAHVCAVHQNSKAPVDRGFEPVTEDFLRTYIAIARNFDPFVTPELVPQIVSHYAELRKQQAQGMGGHRSRDHTYVTPRTLLSILRFAQALARLRFSSEVSKDDVAEAVRLHSSATKSLHESSRPSSGDKSDPTTVIYNLIVKRAKEKKTTELMREDVLKLVKRKGFTEDQLESTVRMYQDLAVFVCLDPQTICIEGEIVFGQQ